MNKPTNPYIAGNPLRDERGFFGRHQTLEWVSRTLSNPHTNPLVLYGQRRIGKTTILYQLQRLLPHDAYVPVYFDLQDQASRSLSQVLADMADIVAESINMEPPDRTSFDDQGRFFQKSFMPRLYKRIGEHRRPIFLLDEFDVLGQETEERLPSNAAAKAFFPFLRRMIREDPRLAFVFVIGRQAEDLELISTFKTALAREIWILDRNSAEALVRQAEENNTLNFTDQAVTRILDLTNNHPYFMQLMCQCIWDRARTKNTTTAPLIDINHVEDAVQNALEVGNHAFIWLWEGLNPAEKIYTAAFSEIATGGNSILEESVIEVISNHAARLRTRSIEVAPHDLVRRRILIETEKQHYRFAVEILQRWISTQRPLSEVKNELDSIEPIAQELFTSGRRLFERSEWKQAAHLFQQALEKNENHFQARLLLGEALLEQDQIDEAVTELGRAYDLDQDVVRFPLARAFVAKAKLLDKRGDEQEALATATSALQVFPNEREAQQIKFMILIRQGDRAREQNDLELALVKYQEAENVAGKFPDKRISYERIDEVKKLKHRQVLRSLEIRAQSYMDARAWSEAVKIYEQLVIQAVDEQERNKWKLLVETCIKEEHLANTFDKAKEHIRTKNWEEAKRSLAEIVHQQPLFESDRFLAGELLEKAQNEQRGEKALREGNLEEALDAYTRLGNADKVTKIQTELRIRELETRAKLHERERRFQEAVATYEQLIYDFPEHESHKEWQVAKEQCWEEELGPRFIEGKKALQEQDLVRAKQIFTEIIRANPNYKKNNQSARQLFDQSKEGLIRQGETALEQGELEKALSVYRELADSEKIALTEQKLHLRKLQEKALADERQRNWTAAEVKYRQLQNLDKERRSEWQKAAERCSEEYKLSYLFDEGAEALDLKMWSRAEQDFAAVVKIRPNYQKGGRSAKALQMTATYNRRLSLVSTTFSLPFRFIAAIIKVLYQEQPNQTTVRWLSSSSIWLPLFFLSLLLMSNISPPWNSDAKLYLFLSIGSLLIWFLTGWFGNSYKEKQVAKGVSIILLIIIVGFAFVTAMSVVEAGETLDDIQKGVTRLFSGGMLDRYANDLGNIASGVASILLGFLSLLKWLLAIAVGAFIVFLAYLLVGEMQALVAITVAISLASTAAPIGQLLIIFLIVISVILTRSLKEASFSQ